MTDLNLSATFLPEKDDGVLRDVRERGSKQCVLQRAKSKAWKKIRSEVPAYCRGSRPSSFRRTSARGSRTKMDGGRARCGTLAIPCTEIRRSQSTAMSPAAAMPRLKRDESLSLQTRDRNHQIRGEGSKTAAVPSRRSCLAQQGVRVVGEGMLGCRGFRSDHLRFVLCRCEFLGADK